MNETENHHICFGCRIILVEPYLCCAECLPPFCYICLSCYASGKEFGLHENRHSYKIVRNNFSILENHWTAAEELKLLDGLSKFGIGNWGGVARFMGSKTKSEVEKHYLKCYINNPIKNLPTFCEIYPITSVRATPIPYRLSVEPPRPSFSSPLFNELAGYMPARGDFVVEHDNYAEFDIKNAEFDNEADTLEHQLHFAALNIYNDRLRERAKRKKIIRNHGLISHRNSFLASMMHSKDFERLGRFSRLLTFDSLYFFAESLRVELELKGKIRQLQEYREMGIKRNFSIQTYIYLKQKREEFKPLKGRSLSELIVNVKDENSMRLWMKKQMVNDSLKRAIDYPSPVMHRRSAPPLEIAGLPGYENLDHKERELCSVLRLVPQAFLQFKSSLISECEKQNGLKLSHARSLIKIDVNKTRKIFDFLVERCVIRKAT